jgi:trafficking protein particle complex subunit 8
MPSTSPPPVPVPALNPRLPPPPPPDSSNSYHSTPTSPDTLHPKEFNTLAMAENDIQQTARFAREFLVMSLIPWMEKCVMDWNEHVSLSLDHAHTQFSHLCTVLVDSSAPLPAFLFDPSSLRIVAIFSCSES